METLAMKTKKAKVSPEIIREAISFWESKLAEMQDGKTTEEVNEDEWLPADDLAEGEDTLEEMDISTPTSGYEPNTVGALIAVLERTCKKTDVILPRVNPGKKELMVFDIYSSNGRAVIDLVPGRLDDPRRI